MVDLVQAIAASFVAHAVFFGFMHTLAVVLVCHKLDIDKVAGYHVLVDVACAVGFTLLYSGTYSGTTVGIFAGLFMSLYLAYRRTWHGYKKLEYENGRLRWFYYHNNPDFAHEYARVRCS